MCHTLDTLVPTDVDIEFPTESLGTTGPSLDSVSVPTTYFRGDPVTDRLGISIPVTSPRDDPVTDYLVTYSGEISQG